MIGIDPLYVVLLAPFVFGAVLGTTAGYLVRAQRAWRDSWAADRRELHWRCELARAHSHRAHPRAQALRVQLRQTPPYQPRHRRRPQPHPRRPAVPTPAAAPA